MEITPFLMSFTAIFVALDIMGALPVYFSLTRSLPKRERNEVVNTSMSVAFLVALVFLFVGRSVFHHLGITLYDFRMAGGVILLLIALSDLHGGPDAVKQTTGSTGIVPLALPLITGPGVLTALVLQVGQYGYGVTILALVLNYGIAWVVLRYCDIIQRWIGKDGTVVVSKITSLLLAAISVSMIRSGLFEAIAAFQGR
jgi:multiple antibiotic resistance protein